MTTKSWLRERAEKAALGCIPAAGEASHWGPRVADVIEQVAHEFAERVIEEVLERCYERGLPQHTKADRELRYDATAAAEWGE